MNFKIDTPKDLSDIVKNVMEVLALVCAGVWAFFTFFVKDKPALEPHADIQTQLVWHVRGEDCVADWNVSVKDIGTSSFDVSSVKVQMWQVDEKDIQYGQFVSPKRLEDLANSKPIVLDDKEGPLTGHYAPNVTDTHSYEWVFKKEPPAKWILLEIDVSRPQRVWWWGWSWFGPKETSLTHAYEWDEMCNPPDEKQAPMTIIRRTP